MSRMVAIALAGAEALAGCGGVDAEEELPAVDDLAARITDAEDVEQLCELTTADLECPSDDVSRLLAGDLADAPVELGEPGAIEDHSLSFDGVTGRLVLCAAGPDCVSDLGAYVLTLKRVDGEWRLAGVEYRVESF